MGKMAQRSLFTVTAVLAAALISATPAMASQDNTVHSTAGSSVTYKTVTGHDGSKYKLVTAINGKRLVDRRGHAAPMKVRPMIKETDCHPGKPVHIRYGIWPFKHDRCFYQAGTKKLGYANADYLRAGKWYGSVYYETKKYCIARAFDPGDTLHLSGHTLCSLSISHS